MLAVITGGTAGGCATRTTDRDIVYAPIGEVRQLVQQRDEGERRAVLLVDPRARSSYERARLPGARHLQLTDVPLNRGRDPAIEAHRQIIVYGDNPGSATARGMVKRMIALGYRNVRMFAGGVEEWRSRGLPIEEGPPEGAPEDTDAPQSRADEPDAASS